MDRNHPNKQQFISIKLKTTRGVSTSTNMPVSNVFGVLGNLKDDGPLDAPDVKDPKHNLRGTHTEENLDENKRKNKKAPRKTGIWLGRNEKTFSELDFTSPNHFDLLTEEDVKTILLNIQESDDDAEVKNGCDDTATPSSRRVTLRVETCNV
ncbi:hypothetical protein Tco_0167636 [Tanacetum coccineum]